MYWNRDNATFVGNNLDQADHHLRQMHRDRERGGKLHGGQLVCGIQEGQMGKWPLRFDPPSLAVREQSALLLFPLYEHELWS